MYEVSGFPVQPAKVQRPPLRDDVLTRDRLLDWLHAKINHRLILILAEAGYGKTTLLTDFAARTRLRTLWYRLDEDDRDWITLLHHLVAAGREHLPSFAPRTAAMLSDTGVAGPSREAVLDMYLRELPAIAEHGAVLILDDFHLVDDAPDARLIVRELVVRAPERVSIVIASRRTPTIPIAKLRAAGEVVELRTDDLRFDATETARLFSETYGRTLEPDVLADLSARTEGWAASLQLVQAALRDRSPMEIRRFVRNLTGADQELYDYLAEEVVGELPEDVQQFLMRTSILQVVTPELARAVTDLAPAEVRRLTATAERFSLLSRRGTQQRDHLRYHPLVRDFLEARLERTLDGRSGVLALHRQVAEAAEGHDWRLACHHYAQIGDEEGIIRTIDDAVEEIVARGDVLVADEFLANLRSADTATSHEVIRSRSEVRRGEYGKALERAEAAAATDPASPVALANLASAAYRVGRMDLADEAAIQLASFTEESSFSDIGRGIRAMLQSSLDGDLQAAVAELVRMRQLQQAREHFHHEGTTLLNMALLHKAQGDARSALTAADEAILLLAQDSTGAELPSAWAVRAWALGHLGKLEEARENIRRAIETGDSLARAEVMLEAAEIEIWYGDSEKAQDLLREARPFIQRHPGIETLYDSISTQLALRVGDVDAARTHADSFPSGLSIIVANKTEQLSLRAYVAVVSRVQSASNLVETAMDHATATGARFWVQLDRLLLAVLHGSEELNREIRRLARDEAVYLSVWAELLVDRANLLGETETRILKQEMAGRGERWVGPLRAAIDRGGSNAVVASEFLEHIGTADDVQRLRRLSRQSKAGYRRDLGKNLARRVADRVYVEDQGRVAIRIGTRYVEGAVIRRKVLALLCFLLTKPRFSAARDEVLEALWPDFEPSIALNSLNQTVYFLRRVFEPAYREDLSPGYVRHESDVVWLDRQLVSSRSQLCADLLKSLPSQPSPSDVERLAAMYQGPFALDFAYEDWAVGFRDSLHAAYLQVMENAVASDLANGHFARGIVVARRALVVDPDSEQIELSLLRLLRLSGAHAAAAEQYAHYSAVLRDSLGIEPPPLDAL